MHILLYSHEDYSYVWPVWARQTAKHLGTDMKISMFVNEGADNLEYFEDFDNIEFYFYRENDTYTERMASCLEKLPQMDTVIFQHEDMFLYDEPDHARLTELIELVTISAVDSIQLIRTTPELKPSTFFPDLYQLPEDLKFCIQPTIIQVHKILELFKKAGKTNIWDFERWCMKNCSDLDSYFVFNGEPKRGIAHYDSSVYPYIATAIVKGNWNTMEYGKELKEILE